MTVLSDKTIKKMIAEEELVSNGNPDSVTQCSYEFTATLMLKGGAHEIEPVTEPGVVIEPAQLVWVRAKEGISIPKNMVGLWIQTQTLARKGLLLLNISLIEPGYKGPVSAVLVNFGNQNVIISPDTKIAKVLFLSLDNDATNLVGEWDSNIYDTKLLKMAANAPKNFLQLQSFEQKADNILDTMKEEVGKSADKVVEDVKGKLEESLKGSLRSHALKWGGGAVFGFLAACGVVWLMMSSYLPRLSEYSKFDEVARRAAMTQQAETITGLNTQLQTQAAEIESLKKQLDELRTSKENLQFQGGTSDMTTLPDRNNAVPNR